MKCHWSYQSFKKINKWGKKWGRWRISDRHHSDRWARWGWKQDPNPTKHSRKMSHTTKKGMGSRKQAQTVASPQKCCVREMRVWKKSTKKKVKKKQHKNWKKKPCFLCCGGHVKHIQQAQSNIGIHFLCQGHLAKTVLSAAFLFLLST